MSALKSIAKTLVTLAVIGGLGAGGYLLYNKYSEENPTSTDKVYVQKVSNINTVTGANLFTNSFSGLVEAQKSVDVKFDNTKTVDEILVADGDTVKKGDKVLTYDIEAIQIEIDTAKLEVERIENSIATNENEIKQLEEEKKKANQDAAVSITTQILSLQSDNARNEYDVKAKNVEITKLEASLKNAYVAAPIDGTVKDLKDPAELASGGGYGYGYSDSSDVIMKITADGNYRVKGIFNEQNAAQIYQDAPVILRSRVDDTHWSGKISEIDTSPQKSSGYEMYSYGESDEQSTSSKYAFYVEPESLDGFMLGQHIIIELDNGQSESINKTGIWLYSDFILTEDGKSYVWAKNDKDKIEKRFIEIGQTDNDYGDCEIISGLATDDYIAYPADYIETGLSTTTNQSDKDIPDNDLGYDEDYEDFGDMEGFDGGDMTFTDEEGNVTEIKEDGSVTVTSPGGGEVIIDSEGNFVKGSISDTGEYIFEEPGDTDAENDTDADTDSNDEDTGKNSAEETPDVTFEEIYGISEEEFNAMTPDEMDEFLKEQYN